jgi:DNA-binding GntR family transcriptional regulator
MAKLMEQGSLVDRLVVEIRDSILTGEFAPGAHIGIKALADAHGVSMIPVREALARMLASRLVYVAANRGYFVADAPTPEEFRQFVQFREMFETSAVALGFDNVVSADIAALRRLNGKMHKIADGSPKALVEWAKLNGAFHQVLVGLARNAFVSEQYQNLSFDHMHFQLARAYNIEFTSLKLLVEQHDAMIAALENRDKAGLIVLLSAHINNLKLGDAG